MHHGYCLLFLSKSTVRDRERVGERVEGQEGRAEQKDHCEVWQGKIYNKESTDEESWRSVMKQKESYLKDPQTNDISILWKCTLMYQKE